MTRSASDSARCSCVRRRDAEGPAEDADGVPSDAAAAGVEAPAPTAGIRVITTVDVVDVGVDVEELAPPVAPSFSPFSSASFSSMITSPATNKMD